MPPRGNPKLPEGINATEENPLPDFLWMLLTVVTGVVVLVVILSFSARWLAPMVPFSWEKKLVENLDLGEVLTEEDLDRDSQEHRAAEQALNELVNSLGSFSRNPQIQYRVRLIGNPMPNAFATLGGQIFVTTGLLQTVQTENGLAMVLAHEMAHVDQRHPLQAAGSGVLVQTALTVITGNSTGIDAVIGTSGLATIRSFSRQMERDSDALALERLLALYGHGAGADEFFRAAESYRNQSARWQSFLETHPGIEERLMTIRQFAELHGQGEPKPLDPRIIKYINKREKTNEL